jgi:hypothetical protein
MLLIGTHGNGMYAIRLVLLPTSAPQQSGNAIGKEADSELKDDMIKVMYPNPLRSNGVLTLEFGLTREGKVPVAIYDVQGKLIFQKSANCVEGTNKIEIEAENWLEGFYLVHVGSLPVKPLIVTH